MGHKAYFFLAITVLLLAACSDKGSEPAQQQTTQSANEPAPVQPATNPAMPPNHPSPSTAPAQQATPTPGNGKVVKAMHAGGYTYMQVENDGKEFWIASTMMNVKRNDMVSWTDAAVMKNFTSSTLRKTFDEILFVSKASIDK
jgi:hypothetical protein